MPPRSESEFADAFRGLSPTARRRFVAAVWDARGWATDVANDVVVARKDGAIRRIRVVRPRWFGGPDLSDVDVVVAVKDRDSLRTAAAAAGAQYVSPTDLRNRLLYGVDRETARTIFAEAFGRPLDAPRTPGRSGAPDGSETLGQSPTPDQSRIRDRSRTRDSTAESGRRIDLSTSSTVALLFLVLLVVAGLTVADLSTVRFDRPSSAGALDVNGSFTPGQTGALGADEGSSTPEPSSYPPGVAADGVTDPGALAEGHHARTENRRYAFSFEFSGPASAPGFEDWEAVEWELVVEDRRSFQVEASFNASDYWESIGVYANGVRDYRIYRTPDTVRTSEMPVAASDADSYSFFAPRVVETYLNTTESSVRCVETSDDTCQVYRVVASGEPTALTDQLEGDASIARYHAVARVTDEGFVTDLVVRYDLVHGGFPETVDLRFSYDDYGAARIEEPPWVEPIREEEGPRTPTRTPPTPSTADGTETDA